MRTTFAIIGFVVVALVVGVCTACVDDDSDESSLVIIQEEEEDNKQSKNKNGNDCHRSSASCSDDDFSPSFDKSPVEDSFNPTVCLPFSECQVPNDPSNDEEGPEPSSR